MKERTRKATKMTELTEMSVLRQYLSGSFATEMEEKLNLKPTKGIPNCNFRYDRDTWESEDEYWDFLNYARKANTLAGKVIVGGDILSYYIVLVEYKGIYYIQVEVEDSHGDIVARVYASDNYQACLKFALAIVEKNG